MKTLILLLAPMVGTVLLSSGELRAQDAPLQGSAFPAGSFPQDVLAVELNGDGRTDLVVANQFSSNLALFLQQPGGGFVGSGSVAVGSQPRAVAAADLDSDGVIDLISADGGSSSISVALGLGGGSFSAAVGHAVGSQPQDLAVGDFDGDGSMDVAVASDNLSQPISLLLGDGAGGFAASLALGQGWGAAALASADIDADGSLDLVVGSLSDDGVRVLRSPSSGYLGAPEIYSVGVDPRGVALVDLDDDGFLDLVSADSGSDSVSVLPGQDGGGFGLAVSYAAGASPLDVVIGDFDGDERPDVVAVNFGSSDLSVFFGDGQGGLADAIPVSLGAGSFPAGGGVGDLDGDHFDDVAVANQFAGSVSVMLSTAGPWIDLGFALPGSVGLPELSGSGEPKPGELVSLLVEGVSKARGRKRGKPPGFLFLGFDRADAPFHGGVLVPSPVVRLRIRGSVPLNLRWGDGIPDGTPVYMQAWFKGRFVAASNALRVFHIDP